MIFLDGKFKAVGRNPLPDGEFAFVVLQFAIDFVLLLDGAFSRSTVFMFRMDVKQIFQVGWDELALDVLVVTGMCDADDILAVEIGLMKRRKHLDY